MISSVMDATTVTSQKNIPSVVFILSVLFAPVEIVLAFVPWTSISIGGNTCRCSGYPSCSTHHVEDLKLGRKSRRRWRERGIVSAARPPDDFIDTTATEDEDTSCVGVSVDFERQELRAIFEAMDENNIFYKMLSINQITEILQLAQALLSAKQTPTDVSKLFQEDAMKGKWKLEFSTEERYKLLPSATDIYNYVYDGPDGGRLDNVIRFYKSWILKSVRAVTKYRIEAQRKVVFEFERIEADLLGFKIPLPKFASEVGFVEVQYFDGGLWIEAFDAPTADKNQTMTVLNIYRRVGDLAEEDKTHIPERTGERGQAQR